MQTPWILILILALLIVFGAIAVLTNKKEKRPPDYYTFFVMGIVWLIFGLAMNCLNDVPLMGNSLFLMGIVFTIFGAANKSKWKANRVTWKDLTKSERKFKIIIIYLLGAIFLGGVFLYLLR